MPITIGTGGKMNAVLDYGTLLANTKPEVAHRDEQYREMLNKLSDLLVRDELNEAEGKLAELLTVLIQEYEKERFRDTEKSPAIEVIKYLMEHQGLKQKDLVPAVFETGSVASEILNGTRGLTLKHVKRLSHYFKLSADIFIDDEGESLIASAS
jgi:HTH-type transcriptional regulator / antitoxin HigA